MAQSSDLAKAVSIVMPLASAFIEIAEESGASGEEKHSAVAEQLEVTYKNLQGTNSIKEIKDVPWELIAPLVIPVGTGIISVIVSLFNRVGRFFQGMFESSEGSENE